MTEPIHFLDTDINVSIKGAEGEGSFLSSGENKTFMEALPTNICQPQTSQPLLQSTTINTIYPDKRRMSCQNETYKMELEEVKACLRALLSSTVFSYNLNALLNDFRNMTGFNLPLFGHLHPIEFLKSLDDTVILFGDSYNPELALVESKKSAHITSLVDRQRSTLRNRPSQSFIKHKRLIIADRNYLSEKENECWRFQSPQFRNFDVNTSQTLLESNSQNRPHESVQMSAFFSQKSSFSSNVANRSHLVRNKPSSSIFCNRRNDLVRGNRKQEEKSIEFEKPESSYFEDISDSESCFSLDGFRSDLPNSSCTINEGIKQKFRKLIRNYPKGLWCCELPELFRKEYNYTVDYREYGYTSLIQMLSELPDVFRCVRPGNEDWVLFDASVAPSPEELKMMDLQASADVRCEVTTNMKKLLSNCFESRSKWRIEMDQILALYEKNFGTLNFQALGFKDLKSFLKTWEGSLFSMLETDGKTLLVPALKETLKSPILWQEAVPPITAENDIFVDIFPKEVVGPDESLLELDLTRHIAVGHVVKVSVAEVWSPSLFYLQLHKFKSRLSMFMDALQKFYNVHLNKYKMPDVTIRPKQVCVGLYTSDSDLPDEWHRAQVVNVINEKIVLVNFIDYGTEARVKKTQLRFLHRRFQSFPVQGFSAQLSGVVPANGEPNWPISTSKKFLEWVRVPFLNAEIVDIDFKKPSMSVILFDPSQKTGNSINRTLVLENLACQREAVRYYLGEKKSEAVSKDSKPSEKCSEEPDRTSCGSVQESPNKCLPEVTDQFSDIADLGQPTLILFKMKYLQQDDSRQVKDEDKTSVENLKYEFEEVPDLCEKIKEVEKDEEEKGNIHKLKKEEILPEPVSPPEESSSRRQPAAETEHSAFPQNCVPLAEPQFSSFSVKPKRLPPGLENANLSRGGDQIQLLPPTDDLKKRINCLAIEFLSKNPSIKQVGMNDPGLALKIATEMAEACLSPEYSKNLTLEFDPRGGTTIPVDPDAGKEPAHVTKATAGTPPLEDAPDKNEVKICEGRKEKGEYVKEVQIGGKTVHVVTIDDQTYFCAEEIVRKFTLFSNREVADRVLHNKKISTDYRVVTKGTDEKVVNALKSCQVPIVKNKTKKLKVYLISSKKVVPFLQALGCHTKTFENEFTVTSTTV